MGTQVSAEGCTGLLHPCGGSPCLRITNGGTIVWQQEPKYPRSSKFAPSVPRKPPQLENKTCWKNSGVRLNKNPTAVSYTSGSPKSSKQRSRTFSGLPLASSRKSTKRCLRL